MGVHHKQMKLMERMADSLERIEQIFINASKQTNGKLDDFVAEAFCQAEETDSRYWDCNCKTDYIHTKFEAVCKRCGARRDESPDSSVNEVQTELLKKAQNILSIRCYVNDGNDQVAKTNDSVLSDIKYYLEKKKAA